MHRFGLSAAVILCVCPLDQPGDFIFALSFKRSLSFDDRTATSERLSATLAAERFEQWSTALARYRETAAELK
jgi:hypothetical protein